MPSLRDHKVWWCLWACSGVGCFTSMLTAQAPVVAAKQAQSLARILSSVLDRLPDSRTAAEQGLERLHQIGNVPGLAEAFGVHSADSLQSSTLGLPFGVLRVHLAALKAFQDTTDPASLLTDARMTEYTVCVGGKPRLVIVVEGTSGDGWTVAETGGPTRAQSFSADMCPPSKVNSFQRRAFLVEIEHTRVSLIGRWVANEFTLTPLTDYPELHWTRSEPRSAKNAFSSLTRIATYNDQRPD